MSAVNEARPVPAARPLDRFPPAVRSYLESIVEMVERRPGECVSVLLYGSSAVGGYSEAVSDVDVMVVLADDAPPGTRDRIRREILELEVRQGHLDPGFWKRGRVRKMADRALGVFVSAFVCPRWAFVAGDPSGIFGVGKTAGRLTSRIIFANILAASLTVWGEDLRPLVDAPPVTRGDVLRSLMSLAPILTLAVLALPFTRDATKYAMAALKKALHNCYFCYGAPPATVSTKAAFFMERAPSLRALSMLLELRRGYRPWALFTLWCAWGAVCLHYRAARDNRFPIPVRAR